MFLGSFALFTARAASPVWMASSLVTGVTKKALWAELIDRKTASLSERNYEHSRIAALVLAMLVEIDVIFLVLVCL
jgi:hypothetical protein